MSNNSLRGCRALTATSVDEDNAHYSSQDGVLFNKEKTTLLQYDTGKAGAYVIPSRVTFISDGTFRDCRALTEVYNYATTPQAVSFATFMNDYGCPLAGNIDLYVLAASVAAYQAADNWKDFRSIVAIGSSPYPQNVELRLLQYSQLFLLQPYRQRNRHPGGRRRNDNYQS